jgi:hypothetical protein
MTNHSRTPPRRIDVTRLREHLLTADVQELEAQNARDAAHYESEYSAFTEAYARDHCYLCGNSFKTLSKERPCVHWMLRRGKFKKKDFPLLFERFGFTQMAAFTRWAANKEQILSGINDLDAHRSERKIFEFTVRWKNIEWTFDCSKNDYTGHSGRHTEFPHFHLQMRIDGRPFIDFGDFHIPFNEEDLFRIDMSRGASDVFQATYGEGGMGMQFGSEIEPERIIEETEVKWLH